MGTVKIINGKVPNFDKMTLEEMDILIEDGKIADLGSVAKFSRPAAPAAPFKWPMLDFTEPRANAPTGRPRPLNTSARLSTSTTSPTFVDVPCPSIRSPADGDTPARSCWKRRPGAAQRY